MSSIFILAIFIIVKTVNIAYINDDGKVKLAFSTLNDHKEILLSNNIKFNDYDKVSYDKKFLNMMFIDIARGNEVKIRELGNETLLYGVDLTVSQLFEQNSFPLGEEDIISIDKNTVINNDMEIFIQRVSYEDSSVTEPIIREVETIYTPLLKDNKQVVLDEGSDGIKQSIYKNKKIDDNIVESVLVTSNVIKPSVKKRVLVGNSKEVISGYNFPGNLTLLKKGAVATAYSARKGSLTASGRPAVVGNIAVNPKVIPYGTKLFIKASDSSFVYGYAVAADTGGFAVNGSNTDVDLFFNTYQESVLFGKQLVDIYIVS